MLINNDCDYGRKFTVCQEYHKRKKYSSCA